MINLLPGERKKQLEAARINTLLVRYIGMTLVATLGVLAVMYGSSMILNDTKMSADSLIETNDTEAGIYGETKQKVSDLSAQLYGAKVVLDEEVRFSEILTGIGKLMPEGTVIGNVDLTVASISSPVTITAYAQTTEQILALQSAFRSSPLVQTVSFQSVSADSGGIDNYPVSVTMTVTFNKEGGQ
ncbi:hypothetical protein GW746_00100 [Candidatus Saccharibacteria bacterium]|nr:hypothetical protein [Candidatus Saccharibacteria bacterium]NCS82806.1 hypothetical protein [Candidatus Saccharibacteria bacterium]